MSGAILVVEHDPAQKLITVNQERAGHRRTRTASLPAGDVSLLDRMHHEALLHNIDASLRIHARHQFFTWTQGMLQNLVHHDVLICALRDANTTAFRVDSFAKSSVDQTLFGDSFCRDTALVPHLVRSWEANHFRPLTCDVSGSSKFAESALGRDLSRIGADVVFAHGTYDVFGKVVSLFLFGCQAGTANAQQLYFVELIVPFVHLAWTRIHIDRATEVSGATSSGTSLLTERQQEILKWIHVGKSNIEIGLILGISSLTVKNHVQNILRKLNVRNRTQAVGKGLALRIISI